jgi:hypothetical protein
MSDHATPLVVTPRPHATESLLGFLLRASAANGYDTPWHILSPVSISRRQAKSADFPIAKLAQLLACKADRLLPIAYAQPLQGDAVEYKILSHSLGQAPRSRTYRMARQAFCPLCVSEKDFMEAHWDLEGVTVCHIHGTRLLTHCPECLKPIDVFRPDLLNCVCGAIWDEEITLPQASGEERALANLVNSRILGSDRVKCEMFNLPIAELEGLPVRSMLAIIDVIGKAASSATQPVEIFNSASQVLAHWPIRYEQLLKLLANTKGAQILPSFRYSLAKSKAPIADLQFLLQPITRHLSDLPPIYPLAAKRRSASAATKKKSPKQHIGRSSMGERQAAAYLGIPVRTLVTLRDTGHYVVQHRAHRLRAFHRADLDVFREKLLATATHGISPITEGCVKLGYVLQEYRLRSHSGKSEVITAILDGVIKPLGVSGKRIGDIVLRKDEILALAIQTRAAAEGNSLSFSEAAVRLGVDPLTVPSMIKEGLLAAVPGPARTRVTIESIDAFDKSHIALAVIARKVRTLSRRLSYLCERHDIPLLTIFRVTGIPQPFIARQDMEKLLAKI